MKSRIISITCGPERRSLLIILLSLVVAFCLATWLGPWEEARLMTNGAGDDTPAARWLGDSRRMFANSFFIKADAYYHSGYYPTIYDNNAPFRTPHIGEDSGTMESKNTGNENTVFSHPNNWVERFELNFFPSYHTHLDQGGVDGNGQTEVKEILPWLKLSEELDRHRIETYLVTAYWLRVRMHRVDDAEEFLRDGLRANPGNPAILFELGQLYRDGRNNYPRARNLYLAALDEWRQANAGKKDPDIFLLRRILGSLFVLEKHEGNTGQAIEYLKHLKLVSTEPAAIQKQIDELDPTSSLFPDFIGIATGGFNPDTSTNHERSSSH